jgi:hypothetical protein
MKELPLRKEMSYAVACVGNGTAVFRVEDDPIK